MNQARPPLYLATGLLLGLALGYLFSVVIFPVEFTDGSPEQLNQADKMLYRSLAAQAFAVSNNLERASARINLLGDIDPGKELAGDAQRMLAEGKPLADAEILARLASELNAGRQVGGKALSQPQGETSIPLFTPNAEEATAAAFQSDAATPDPNGTPQPLATRAPTPTPAPTLGAPFELAERLVVCEADKEPGLIEVQVDDQAGRPIPGVRVDISWQGGEEFFFTGLIQTVNSGYADYQMTSGVEYALRVGEGGEQARGVSIPECSSENGEKFPGSVYLRFTQP